MYNINLRIYTNLIVFSRNKNDKRKNFEIVLMIARVGLIMMIIDYIRKRK